MSFHNGSPLLAFIVLIFYLNIHNPISPDEQILLIFLFHGLLYIITIVK